MLADNFFYMVLSKVRLKLQMDNNFLKIQHSASVFGQRPIIFKYSAYGFGRM